MRRSFWLIYVFLSFTTILGCSSANQSEEVLPIFGTSWLVYDSKADTPEDQELMDTVVSKLQAIEEVFILERDQYVEKLTLDSERCVAYTKTPAEVHEHKVVYASPKGTLATLNCPGKEPVTQTSDKDETLIFEEAGTNELHLRGLEIVLWNKQQPSGYVVLVPTTSNLARMTTKKLNRDFASTSFVNPIIKHLERFSIKPLKP